MPSAGFATRAEALARARALRDELAAKGVRARIVVEGGPESDASGPPSSPWSDHALTPLTADLVERARAAGFGGVGVLLGGDLEDMHATLVVYKDTQAGEDRPVLWAKVLAEAEPKIMAAIARAQGVVHRTVAKRVRRTGRAPWDTQHQVAERLVQYAKSVNHHVGDGTPIPSHTLDGIKDLRAVLDAVDPSALTPSETAALEGYKQDLEQVAQAAEKREKTPRKDYGPRTCEYVQTVDETVAVPAGADGMTAVERPGSRLEPHSGANRPIWCGDRRSETASREFAIDFDDDGWSAVYHPSDPKYKVPFSRRGTLELHMPPGADPAAIPDHLARLNLNGAPATRAEAEIVYLSRCAWAMGLDRTREWQAAKAAADALAHRRAAEIVWEKALSDAAGAVGRAMQAAARDTAPARAKLLRRAVERTLGMPEGGLLAHPRYRPEPVWDPARGEGGAYRWERFDVDPEEVGRAAAERGLVIGHKVAGGSSTRAAQIKRVLETGVLAAQETRLAMGVAAPGAMSPLEDQQTGGAAYVFCRVCEPGYATFEWDPAALLRRSDWFYRPGDHFGAVNPADPRGRAPRVTDPLKALHPAHGNEIVFKGGIGIYGPYAPTRIRVGDPFAREDLLAWCKERGITHIGGRPVEQVIV